MTAYIVPALLMVILMFSMSRTSVYSAFISGAEEGMKTVLGIFPAILAILSAVSMLRASGALDFLLKILSPVTEFIKIPKEVMPLALLRPMSGGASLGVLTDILRENGPDSLSGIIAAVMMGSTETTFYTLSVYFGKTRVKYTKKIIPAAVIGDIVGLLAAVYVCRLIF